VPERFAGSVQRLHIYQDRPVRLPAPADAPFSAAAPVIYAGLSPHSLAMANGIIVNITKFDS
tara:strand:- start:3621 stop:3806 length:186 start_codon:yes stop_codon:yes gene_type:complete